jgi:hypothetical protein
MIAILFLLGSFVMGAGICRRLFGDLISPLEKVFWGIITGQVLAVWAAYIICRLLGNVYFGVMLSLTVVIWLTGIYFFRPLPKNFRIFAEDGKYLLLLAICFVPVYAYFFGWGMFYPNPRDNGIYLTSTSWYDMAFHLAIATSFLYGKNFPPAYMVLPEEPLRYPFLPDFHITVLMNLGLGIWPSFAFTAIITATALTAVFYFFVRRLTDSKGGAVIATFLFFLNGGFGFIHFFEQWRISKMSLYTFLPTLKNNYTDMWDYGIKWSNLITSGLIPQRAMLYGMPAAFIVLTLFAIIWRRWAETEDEKRWDSAGVLIKAGILTGLLPLIHVHSYMMLGMVSIVLFLIKPRYSWLAFWVPAVLLAVPQVANLGGHVASGTFLQFHPGWMSYLEKDRLLFMVRNFGLPILLIFPAIFAAPKYLRLFYLPFVAIFIFCFLFIISPNEFDNLKLMYYWNALTAAIIALWLAKLATEHRQRFLTGLLIIISVLSAVLSIYRESFIFYRLFSEAEIEAGNFARDNLPAKAMILTGQYSNQPLLCLAGKPVVLGYQFWILSHGYTEEYFNAVKDDVKSMYEAKPTINSLLEKYKVDYIYVGPNEKSELKPDLDYLNRHYTLAFRNKDVLLYNVRKPLD